MKSSMRVASLVAMAALWVCGTARADVVTNLNFTLNSGATWSGTVTFFDNDQGMKTANGVLSGGGYSTTAYTWTWWNGTSQTNPQDYDGNASTYEDILMGGGLAPNWNQFIGISWFKGNVGDMPVLNLTPNNLYFASFNGGGTDVIVSGGFANVSTVPEPTSLLLAGLGLAAAGMRRRRAG